MHALTMMAHLNAKANENAKKAREFRDRPEVLEYTQQDMDESIQQAREEGYQNGLEDNSIGYDYGHEDGFTEGREKTEEEFSGPDPLVILLKEGMINPYDPVTLVYDAAIKSIVYTQGEFSVTQSA